MNRLLILFLLVFGWSCGPDINKKKGVANKYFDIVGLIDQQVKLLDSVSLSLLKKATIDGIEEEISVISPDSSFWEKELTIFKLADINKPMLLDSYEFAERDNGGGKTIIYVSKFPEATQVDSLALSFTDYEENPISIHARISGSNALFESEMNFDLAFNKVNAQHLLSHYNIEGWQKMISKDSITYLIEGAVE